MGGQQQHSSGVDGFDSPRAGVLHGATMKGCKGDGNEALSVRRVNCCGLAVINDDARRKVGRGLMGGQQQRSSGVDGVDSPRAGVLHDAATKSCKGDGNAALSVIEN